MIYSEYKRDRISTLGLSLKSGDNAAEIINCAVTAGVNYFDVTNDGNKPDHGADICKILSALPRESYRLAASFPGYDVLNMKSAEEVFEHRLKQCGALYYDFYMFYNVGKSNVNEYLDPENGVFDYLMKQRVNGRIKHLGLSSDGDFDVTRRFLYSYGQFMEFCQIEYTSPEDNKELTEFLNQYMIPVFAVNPSGGVDLFKALQNKPEVKVIIAGAPDTAHLKEYLTAF